MESPRGRSNVARNGGRADERASQKGNAQKHPRMGTRALLQQRAHGGGPRLLRRRSNLLRAQGQGQRHSALHLRDDRGTEDRRRGRRAPRLDSIARESNFRELRNGEVVLRMIVLRSSAPTL